MLSVGRSIACTVRSVLRPRHRSARLFIRRDAAHAVSLGHRSIEEDLLVAQPVLAASSAPIVSGGLTASVRAQMSDFPGIGRHL
jgi:hypothetical protein